MEREVVSENVRHSVRADITAKGEYAGSRTNGSKGDIARGKREALNASPKSSKGRLGLESSSAETVLGTTVPANDAEKRKFRKFT